MARVLLLAPTTAYQTDDFLAAAERLGVEVVLGTDRCHVLAEDWPEGALALDFRNPAGVADQVAAEAGEIDGVVVTDEVTAVIGALVAERFGLRANAAGAARASANKLALRERLAAAGVRQPSFLHASVDVDPEQLAARVDAELGYPVVVKPLHLSTSRGVMRADDAAELADRVARLRDLLADPEVIAKDPDAAATVLVERFVPGAEVAFEGLLRDGELVELALFDKPEPLDGPFFAETIYVTPSRLLDGEQRAVRDVVAAAASAIELSEGPVHAELRLGPEGPVAIEVAARSIGGLCGRALRFGPGLALEEVVLAHAVGREVATGRTGRATGVCMLPVPRGGVLKDVKGVDRAEAIDGITAVEITARVGDDLVPLPEGNKYVGFLFAEADEPAAVVQALHTARGKLRLRVAPKL